MFDQLMDLVRGNAREGIIDNHKIPNEKNEEAVKGAGNSIMATLQNALSSGRIQDVFSYFKQGRKDDPIVKEATDKYANDLKQNYGLSEPEARDAAAKVVPNAMSQLATKTADPADNSFNIQDIFNKLSGGKTGSMNVQNMFAKFKGGLDKDNDGDVDFQDLKSMFSGSGSVMDKVKGMFS